MHEVSTLSRISVKILIYFHAFTTFGNRIKLTITGNNRQKFQCTLLIAHAF